MKDAAEHWLTLTPTRLRDELAARFADWRGVLRRQPTQARQILEKVLARPLTFKPQRGGYYSEHPTYPSGSNSIRRRPFDAVDHQHLQRPFLCFEPETELLPEGIAQGRRRRLFRQIRGADRRRCLKLRSRRRVLDNHVEQAGEARAIDHRSSKLGRDLRQEPLERHGTHRGDPSTVRR